MTTEIMILTSLMAFLVGLHHLLGKDVTWCRTLDPKLRIVLTNIIGIPIGLVVSRLSGSEWVQAAYQTGMVVGIPTLLGVLSVLGGSDKPPAVVDPPILAKAKDDAANLGIAEEKIR